MKVGHSDAADVFNHHVHAAPLGEGHRLFDDILRVAVDQVIGAHARAGSSLPASRNVSSTCTPESLASCNAASNIPSSMPKAGTISRFEPRLGEQPALGGQVVHAQRGGFDKSQQVGINPVQCGGPQTHQDMAILANQFGTLTEADGFVAAVDSDEGGFHSLGSR